MANTARPPHEPADPTITEAELREEYARTGLARSGVSYDHAMTIEPVRTALAIAIKSRRRTEAKQAQGGLAIHHKQQEAA